jgi:hypothetical protein
MTMLLDHLRIDVAKVFGEHERRRGRWGIKEAISRSWAAGGKLSRVQRLVRDAGLRNAADRGKIAQ